MYQDGPIATSINSPYLKYKTVPIGTTVKTPEINMIVTVKCLRNYEIYEFYTAYADDKRLELKALYTYGPPWLDFVMNTKGIWVFSWIFYP